MKIFVAFFGSMIHNTNIKTTEYTDMITYRSLAFALSHADVIKLEHTTYQIEAYDSSNKSVQLYDRERGLRHWMTVEDIEKYADTLQIWELTPVEYKK